MRTDDLMQGARNVVKNSLCLAQRDVLCIITDEKTLDIGTALKEAASEITKHISFFVMEHFGKRDDPENPLKFPDEIKKAMEKSTASIYAAGATPNEIQAFRTPMMNLVEKHRIKHAHMITVSRRMMKEGILTPVDKLSYFTRKVYQSVTGSKEVRITSLNGTDITMELDPRGSWLIDDGLVMPGHLQNLPGGEVFTSPVTANGRIVADGSLSDYFGSKYGLLRRTPLTIDIKDCQVTNVECDNKKLLSDFKAYIKKDEYANYVGELGLGTNFGVKELIGDPLQDEKFPGVHIAIGCSFPDTGIKRISKVHCDCIISGCNVWVDGNQIMKEGKYLI